MSQAPSESFKRARPSLAQSATNMSLWVSLAASVLILGWFYFFVPRYGAGRAMSAVSWIWSAWNDETGYEHGPLAPVVIIGLIIYRLKEIKAAVTQGSHVGLISVLLGSLIYLVAFRTLQPRIVFAALPFLLWGAAHCLWGWRVAKILAFPLFFFFLAIPFPSFQQYTTHLQMLATSMAHHGSSLFGVETYVEGTVILPTKGDWKPLDIAGGCSGIRSLMALLMVSAAWAYIAKIAYWKKIILFLSAVPLAIIGNAMRITSIFVIAEYGNADFAVNTWHDWSGLLLFYPISLVMLLLIHSLFEGRIPWKNLSKKQVTKKIVTSNFNSQRKSSEP